MRYPIAIEPGDQHHAFGVVVPDLPGCFSAGDTLDEALINAGEAIRAYVELLEQDGQPIPPALTINDHVDNPDFAGWVWALVECDPV